MVAGILWIMHQKSTLGCQIDTKYPARSPQIIDLQATIEAMTLAMTSELVSCADDDFEFDADVAMTTAQAVGRA